MKHPAIAILEELIAIPSVNPAFDPTSQGEALIAEYIEARCARSGLKTWRQSVFEGRDNLIVELDLGKQQTLLFESHMDTVLAGGMTDAFAPYEKDGLLYGRGSCDTKATLASMLTVLEEAAKNPLEISCNLMLCCAVDEEHGARGIAEFVKLGLPIAGAVVGEPTELRIVVAHKGCARFALKTTGKAAHSSVPHEGDSAVFQMVKVLDFIKDEIEPALALQVHPLCGSPTIVVGTIRGGTQINIVPESCEIEIDRRLIPGETAAQVIREFGDSISHLEGVNFEVRDLLIDQPLNTSIEAEIVTCARDAAQKLSLNSELAGVPFGSDASKLQQIQGVPTIVFGPGSIAQAHTVNEYVPIHEVVLAAQFYRELAGKFGRTSEVTA